MTKILIVEDEEKIAQLLADYLRQEGFDTHSIHDGNEVMPYLEQHGPDYCNGLDVILMDLMLPGRSGLDLSKTIRNHSNIPILIITAKVEEIDRLLGLELGADDYICKPFSPREVVARVKAVLRRMSRNTEQSSPLVLDDDRYLATLHGNALDLTAIEYQLLGRLACEPGRIFTRQQLIDGMYNDNRVVSDRTVDSHIKKLRKKLATHDSDNEVIRSVYGVGYKLEFDVR